MHNITADVVLDSLSPTGTRLTTLQLTMPKFLVAQINTHRKFSRNSQSSRAVPISRTISHLRSNFVTPADFGVPANGSGMRPKAMLEGARKWWAVVLWYLASRSMIVFAFLLERVGLHKAWVNRLLEPFSYSRVLITSTEWHNFLTLRDHGDAQDAMREVARAVSNALAGSVPMPLRRGEIHAPYVGHLGTELDFTTLPQTVSAKQMVDFVVARFADELAVSVSCCAQVSFRTADNSVTKARRVMASLNNGDVKHLSPFEHVAICSEQPIPSNFDGDWVQYRKLVE